RYLRRAHARRGRPGRLVAAGPGALPGRRPRLDPRQRRRRGAAVLGALSLRRAARAGAGRGTGKRERRADRRADWRAPRACLPDDRRRDDLVVRQPRDRGPGLPGGVQGAARRGDRRPAGNRGTAGRISMNRLPFIGRPPLLAALAVSLLLGACAGPRGPAGTARGGPDASAGGASGVAAASCARRGGGYYLDDGPGCEPPADLAAIPDAVPRA